MSDSISNLINKLSNASRVKAETVVFPYSGLSFNIVESLEKAGFVQAVAKKGKKVVKTIEAKVVYENGVAKIKGVKRISKQSRRIYLGAKDIRPIKNGFGKVILSTPVGILTGEDARKAGVGGEPLFEIW